MNASHLRKKVTELQASLAAIASDFPTFVRAAFAVLYPGKELLDNWHVDAMAHALLPGAAPAAAPDDKPARGKKGDKTDAAEG